MIRNAALISVAIMAVAARAEPRNVPVKPTQNWQHKPSSFAFPPTIGAFKRTEIRDFSEDKRIELGATYRDDAGTIHATLFVYRPAMPDAALWFDVSNWYLQRNGHFGQVTSFRGPTAFGLSPNGRSVALRQTYAISEIGRSSGVAVAAYGPWIVKLRMTSRSLEPAALDEALHSFMTTIPWRAKLLGSADKVPLARCAKPLKTSTTAEEIRQDGGSVMIGAMLAMTAEDLKSKGTEEQPRLCRDDSNPKANFPLYQLNEGSTGYVIATGDNGTLLAVQDDPLTASTMAKKDGQESAPKPFYRVTRMSPSQWEQYAAFAQLPAPQQALDAAQGNPKSTTTVGGKGSKTTIDHSVLE